jgi:CTP:molybdopterin cytidylyltransferase MocA
VTVAGVVLAGGRSRRMGKNKALLRCGEETFLDRLASRLAQGGCQPVLAVVSEPGPIRQGCRLDQVRLVVNPDPDRGQISSLRCGLDGLPDARGVVVLLVDQGDVRAETVRLVRQTLEGTGRLVLARHRGQPGHPVGFPSSLFGLLRSTLADQGARRVVQREGESGCLEHVDVEDPGVIRNINTPDAYQDFLRRAGLNR